MALHAFPPTTVIQPRRTSVKKAKSYDSSEAPGELKGVAIQLNTMQTPPGVIQPAGEHFKHTLFCEPTSRSATPSRGSLKRRDARRRSTGPVNISNESPVIPSQTSSEDDDQVRPLPENTHFRSYSPSHSSPSDNPRRPILPNIISTEIRTSNDTLASPGGDRLSPLPTKLTFSMTCPTLAEHPVRRPPRAGSLGPSLARSSSGASATLPSYSPGDSAPVRSIFPQYDHSKPLKQQPYYPSGQRLPAAVPSEKVSKYGSSVEKKMSLERLNIPTATVQGYEHIPMADRSDLLAIWNASCDKTALAGPKVQLSLLQPRGQGTSLAIGVSENDLLYSMEKDLSAAPPEGTNTYKQLAIKKHSPKEKPLSSAVATLALPESSNRSHDWEKEVVSIFPQMAAINAIEIVANSPAASAIATFDPKAASPEAARLGRDAVSEAHSRYRCELVRSTRKKDSVGAVTATYKLEHPTLGTFPITITKSTIGRHSRDPRAKISVHHPSATPEAVTAENLVLAYLDFALNACVLDIPGLLGLEGQYIIDTVVCALLAVAVIENDVLVAETLTFDAPPKAPLPSVKSKTSSSGSSKKSRGAFGRKKKSKDIEGEQVELPVLTQGALAVLGLSFKTAVWILQAGVKVTTGVVLGVSHMASKA